MEKKKRADHMPYEPAPSAKAVFGSPEDCCEYVNKYGTYNIQPTCDTENSFPTIAQGYSKKGKKSIKIN